MTTPFMPVGPLTPYVTPATLVTAPTGIAWSTIPPGKEVTAEQRVAEQWNICMRATALADECTNQVLRATTNDELLYGPDWRVTYQQDTGNTRVIMSRWPILAIQSVSTCPAGQFPRVWTALQPGWYEPEVPPLDLYGTVSPAAAGGGGQAIIIGPGCTDWSLGRRGYALKISYTNGWPHAGITAAAAKGSTSLQVDDCTGWAITRWDGTVTGAVGVIKDSGAQEVVQVTAASKTAGPGTLTLASALVYSHSPGIAVTSMPGTVEDAVIDFCAAEALTRGATTTTVQSVRPASQSSGQRAAALREKARGKLHAYRRTI